MQLFDAKARVSSSIKRKWLISMFTSFFQRTRPKEMQRDRKRKQSRSSASYLAVAPCPACTTAQGARFMSYQKILSMMTGRFYARTRQRAGVERTVRGGMHSMDREEWQWWIDAIHPNDPEPQQPHSFSHAPSCPLLHLHAASSFPSSSATVRVCG
jgi:hypothetical protein